jgi:multidrug efflux pump subunit AcrA (membrane-fusion protein)
VSTPLLTVTGSVVAQLRPGSAPAEDRWQFNTPELLTAYTDWRKSNADVELAEKQLKEIRELTEDRIATQKKLVERLRKLVDAGTDSPKDLAAEEGNLRQATIQGRKDIIEAATAVRVAARNRAGLERLLSQAGADPHLLAREPEGTTIVVADVPEAKVGLVREGQACQARFYAFPGKIFTGKVSSLAPTIAKERRTLRVLFELGDPEGRLRPGMFADVGLGTDARDALMAPTDGVLHVGLGDYMLVETSPGVWRVTAVKVGEVRGSRIESLQGVKAGDKVLGKGAILLKPFVVQAVQGAKVVLSETEASPGERSGP